MSLCVAATDNNADQFKPKYFQTGHVSTLAIGLSQSNNMMFVLRTETNDLAGLRTIQ